MNVRRTGYFLLLFSCFLFLPATVWGQADTGNIIGIVRDTSGAVLPGVTVEAASPALIEKIRTAVSDEGGRYRIGDLRPGTYTVTFALPGFSTLKRESIELTSGFTATVNADLKVGAREETITVSEQVSPVDTQNVQQQITISNTTLDALPTPKRPAQLITLIPSANAGGTNFHDVGGVGSDRGFFGVHGQRPDDMTYNISGMDNRVFSGGGFQYNSHTFQELVVETASGSAESTTGGVQINIIPKDGGNKFSGSASIEATGSGLVSDNTNDALRARGLQGAPSVKKYYDVGGGFGGPIKKDKLWFFAAFRRDDRAIYQVGNYYNKLQHTLFYEPDLTRRAYNGPLYVAGGCETQNKFVIHPAPSLPMYICDFGAGESRLRARSHCGPPLQSSEQLGLQLHVHGEQPAPVRGEHGDEPVLARPKKTAGGQ